MEITCSKCRQMFQPGVTAVLSYLTADKAICTVCAAEPPNVESRGCKCADCGTQFSSDSALIAHKQGCKATKARIEREANVEAEVEEPKTCPRTGEPHSWRHVQSTDEVDLYRCEDCEEETLV